MKTTPKTPMGGQMRQKPPKPLTPEERERLDAKMAAAERLGLLEKVERVGWGGLTAAESGRVGGEMTRHARRGGSPEAASPSA